MFSVYETETGKLVNVCEPEELSKFVLETVKYYQEKADALQQMNERLKNDAAEVVLHEYERELGYLRNRLNLSYGEFASQKELNAYNQFIKDHMHDRETSKYNGGRAPYLIPTHTGIGTVLHVKCPICGAERDITDTEAW